MMFENCLRSRLGSNINWDVSASWNDNSRGGQDSPACTRPALPHLAEGAIDTFILNILLIYTLAYIYDYSAMIFMGIVSGELFWARRTGEARGWILACDWSRLITWPEYWPLIGCWVRGGTRMGQGESSLSLTQTGARVTTSGLKICKYWHPCHSETWGDIHCRFHIHMLLVFGAPWLVFGFWT